MYKTIAVGAHKFETVRTAVEQAKQLDEHLPGHPVQAA